VSLNLASSEEAYRNGRDKMDVGDYDTAIRFFEESIAAFPHFKTLELLGECKLKVGQPLDSIVPLAAAIGLGTNEFRAMYLLAKAFASLDRKPDAMKFVDLALKTNPSFKAARKLRDSMEGP
jgi:tetratricopeptide (TPR) repeat protein